MKTRLPYYLTLAVIVAACGGDTAETESQAAVETDAEPVMDDAALVAALGDSFVTHFNLGHPSMVADLYADQAVRLNANGEINMGKAAITASLEGALASSPVLAVTPDEHVVMGEHAITRGTYALEVTPEGAGPMAYGGAYLSAAQKIDGEWKIVLTSTNYDASPPDGWTWVAPDASTEEVTDGPFAELISGYTTHYNLGHPAMVADYYAEDAVVSFADSPWVEGRAAITASLEEAIAMGSPQLTVHNADTWELGDGMYLDGGWYEVVATTPDGEVNRGGTYVTIASKADDGSAQIHWMISNGWPVGQ